MASVQTTAAATRLGWCSNRNRPGPVLETQRKNTKRDGLAGLLRATDPSLRSPPPEGFLRRADLAYLTSLAVGCALFAACGDSTSPPVLRKTFAADAQAPN